MRCRRRNSLTAAECRMRMTPMIDVTFQLLIFFILVTEIQKTVCDDIALPVADQARPDVGGHSHRLTVNVTENGEMRVMRRSLPPEALGRLIEAEREVYTQVHVHVRADRNVEYAAVQRVVEQCVGNEITRLSFAASREPAERSER